VLSLLVQDVVVQTGKPPRHRIKVRR
jgi:hypothetical protein